MKMRAIFLHCMSVWIGGEGEYAYLDDFITKYLLVSILMGVFKKATAICTAAVIFLVDPNPTPNIPPAEP